MLSRLVAGIWKAGLDGDCVRYRMFVDNDTMGEKDNNCLKPPRDLAQATRLANCYGLSSLQGFRMLDGSC